MPGFLWANMEDVSQDLSNSTDSNCVLWIYKIFGQCVVTDLQYAGVICGMVSICAWAINGMPQMIENCKTGKAHLAMSIYLLVFWTIGDSLNLTGCLLTHQLPLQTATAAFSIACDIFLLSQWFIAYVGARRWRQAVHSDVTSAAPWVNDYDHSAASSSGPTFCACVATAWLLGCSAAASRLPAGVWAASGPSAAAAAVPGGRRLLFYQPVFLDTQDIIGYVMGCLSSCCYLSSRIPQLTKNFIRRSTEGLSAALFILALVGNATYAAQIFCSGTDGLWIIRHFPWIFGSLGVMTLDFVMMGQFFVFRKRSAPLQSIRVDAEDEQNLIYS